MTRLVTTVDLDEIVLNGATGIATVRIPPGGPGSENLPRDRVQVVLTQDGLVRDPLGEHPGLRVIDELTSVELIETPEQRRNLGARLFWELSGRTPEKVDVFEDAREINRIVMLLDLMVCR